MEKERFWYNRHCFMPYAKLPTDKGFSSITKKLYSTYKAEFTSYDLVFDGPPQYDYQSFYQAAGESEADLFFCLQDGRLYCPGQNELFLWTGTTPTSAEVRETTCTRMAMSTWAYIKADYDSIEGVTPIDDIVSCVSIDAFKTTDPDEPGSVVAKIIKTRSGDTGVVYIDFRALGDPYAQHIIQEAKGTLKEYTRHDEEL